MFWNKNKQQEKLKEELFYIKKRLVKLEIADYKIENPFRYEIGEEVKSLGGGDDVFIVLGNKTELVKTEVARYPYLVFKERISNVYTIYRKCSNDFIIEGVDEGRLEKIEQKC